MNRLSVRYGIVWLLLLMTAVLPSVGCRSAIAGAVLLFKGTDVDAECGELKGKKVAVVCRPMVNLQYRDVNVARDLAQQISVLLQTNVSRIHVVEQRKVAKWADENTWEEYSEVGKAMKADMVVGIDLGKLQLVPGTNALSGQGQRHDPRLRLQTRQ